MYHDDLLLRLRESKSWLITGVAGFIGSNILEVLLKYDQRVVGLDNLETGYQRNLDEVRDSVTKTQWSNFKFIDGDIRNLSHCRHACSDVDFVLHQAALGSVPRSIDDPIQTNLTNVGGFLNMLIAAREAQVTRFVYASSSSVYGDDERLPKEESLIGNPLSPYAVSKYTNEIYAHVFGTNFYFQSVGLRYFNVFGPRQDPNGPYAAVIPKWIDSVLRGSAVVINGDGQSSRDFCFVENVIQANILAATTQNPLAVNQVYNIAVGERSALTELFSSICTELELLGIGCSDDPIYKAPRAGDVRHSHADVSKAKRLLRYEPAVDLRAGIKATVGWYLNKKRGEN